ncbi:hypothetical protein C8R44DRAFT_855321 [Mycena epipterygia]|nr:hypothetical protein C8R44DRAFT_855321 [Mycena epipterygia]
MPARRPPAESVRASHIDTPYKDLLYTNIVPSDEDCRRIRDLVVAPMKEVEELTEEIAHLQAIVDQLTHKRDGLAEFIDSHLALVACARRVPHDILGEIFMASLPSEHAVMHRRESPLLLSHVCSDWRSLALSMPHLWSSLHIAGPPRNPWLTLGKIKEGLKSWLDRSGALPLSISYVWDPRRKNAQADRDCSLLLTTLGEHSRRWGDIRFILPSVPLFSPLGALSPDDVPLLRTIIIDAGPAFPLPNQLTFFSFIRSTSVRGVSLRSPFHSSRIQNLLPWSQLCTLSLPSDYAISLDMDIALELFQQCPKLETCTLAIFYGNHIPSTSKPICMEHMRQLSLSDSPRALDLHFFKRVKFPNLRSLDYKCHTLGSDRDLLPILACLDTASYSSLTNLGLSPRPLIDDLADCLRLFPMLQKLVLHNNRHSLAHSSTQPILPFFSLLTPPPPNLSVIICPHLHDICLLGINGGSDQELLALVHTRRTSGHNISPLSRIHVVSPRDREVDISPQLAAVGLAFTLRYLTAGDMSTYRPASVNARRQPDADADWGVLSTSWLAEYAESPV